MGHSRSPSSCRHQWPIGFHRDELATLDDAHSLAWGYVAYPPLTPFLARIAFILFGPSLIGLRLFAAVALGLVLVLTGLMARHMGGGRQAQIVAALAASDRRCRIERRHAPSVRQF